MPATKQRKKKVKKLPSKRKTKRKGPRSGRIALLAVLLLFLALAAYGWQIDGRVARLIAFRDTAGPGAVYSAPFTIRANTTALALRQQLVARGYKAVADESQLIENSYVLSKENNSAGVKLADGSQLHLTLATDDSSRSLVADNPQQALPPILLGSHSTLDRASVPLVALEQFPPFVPQAVIAAEDERFYSHFGIDLLGIGRAVLTNIASGHLRQGGSTLTQQLAKNLLFSSERSFSRKFSEAFAAVSIERQLTKKQILEWYLNEVYLGQVGVTALHGFPAACQHFFGHPINEITLSEAAMLAGIIKAPSSLSPERWYARALERMHIVLGQLEEQRLITVEQKRAALQHPPKINLGPTGSARAPFVINALSEQQEINGPLNTTIDPVLQECGERAVSLGGQALDRRLRRSKGDTGAQIGFVAIEPRSGNVRAYVGGRNFGINQYDHVNTISRQLGSIIKPLVYLTALDGTLSQGKVLTAADILTDQPLEVKDGNRTWVPHNFDREYRGKVTVRYALENSLNIPAIMVAERVGIDTVANVVERFQAVQSPPHIPSLAVGAVESTLLRITGAYAALASGGLFTPPHILAIDNPEPTRIADEPAVFVLTNILQGVVERGTAAKLRALGITIPLAGKTGTSSNSRDAWFVGYSPEIALGVWVGFDDNRPLGLTGGGAAVPIAVDFLRCAREQFQAQKFVMPEGAGLVSLDRETGLRTDAKCPGHDTYQEFFVEGTEPRYLCSPEGEIARRAAEPWWRKILPF